MLYLILSYILVCFLNFFFWNRVSFPVKYTCLNMFEHVWSVLAFLAISTPIPGIWLCSEVKRGQGVRKIGTFVDILDCILLAHNVYDKVPWVSTNFIWHICGGHVWICFAFSTGLVVVVGGVWCLKHFIENWSHHDAFDTVDYLHRPDIKTSNASQICAIMSANQGTCRLTYNMISLERDPQSLNLETFLASRTPFTLMTPFKGKLCSMWVYTISCIFLRSGSWCGRCLMPAALCRELDSAWFSLHSWLFPQIPFQDLTFHSPMLLCSGILYTCSTSPCQHW